MSLLETIKNTLSKELSPSLLEVTNESHLHHRNPAGETHFRILVISEKFKGMTRVERQRLVNSLTSQARAQGLHALSMQTLTGEEWAAHPKRAESPQCAGANSDSDK
jgi:BolA family transcriptional regulator, general stress-responsive regulator